MLSILKCLTLIQCTFVAVFIAVVTVNIFSWAKKKGLIKVPFFHAINLVCLWIRTDLDFHRLANEAFAAFAVPDEMCAVV